ncbi:malonyl-CoA decarboxylase domain-containing protein [Sphingobium sp. MK2]|uniref:malonyl-CoA decarboxylase domain-containing protein n=1 Tax=Sphingobium sp. MK2 TaxID=3116540 RepID=UPI0032E367A5
MEMIRSSRQPGASSGPVPRPILNLASSVGGLFDALVTRMRHLGAGQTTAGVGTLPGESQGVEHLRQIARKILSEHAHAVGTMLSTSFIEGYARLDSAHRLETLQMLAREFGPDRQKVANACKAFLDTPGDESLRQLVLDVEPPRQELFRRINQAPFATLALVRLRAELLSLLPQHPELRQVDDDLVHLFHSWFNRGFLIMQRIDWNSSAHLLDKIVAYEAVHSIGSLEDLRRRLAPGDRRCYAFFHPALLDEPLIFVEVALSDKIESSIATILSEERHPLGADVVDTAMFYSISNCQAGLQGVSFGHHLLQQVVDDLRGELPGLKRFVTLSPVPGFMRWLREEQAQGNVEAETLLNMDSSAPPTQAMLLGPALRYLTEAKDRKGRPRDPVMRFHLGNGARLERLCIGGDLSASGMAQSLGLMVNYRYEIDALETNRARFLKGEVPLGDPVKEMLTAGFSKSAHKKDR